MDISFIINAVCHLKAKISFRDLCVFARCCEANVHVLYKLISEQFAKNLPTISMVFIL